MYIVRRCCIHPEVQVSKTAADSMNYDLTHMRKFTIPNAKLTLAHTGGKEKSAGAATLLPMYT